jgi:hypothetical protein
MKAVVGIQRAFIRKYEKIPLLADGLVEAAPPLGLRSLPI